MLEHQFEGQIKKGLCAQSQEFQSKLKEASLHDNVNTATELVSQTLVAACKTAGLKFQKQKSSYKQRKTWFDQERKLKITWETNFPQP